MGQPKLTIAAKLAKVQTLPFGVSEMLLLRTMTTPSTIDTVDTTASMNIMSVVALGRYEFEISINVTRFM